MRAKILSIILAALLSSVAMALNPVVDVNQDTSSSGITCDGTEYVGQSFIQGDGLYVLTAIWVKNLYGAAPFEFTIEIREGDGGGVENPGGLPLVASVTNNFNPMPADSWFKFDFPNIDVVPNAKYTFFCKGTGVGSTLFWMQQNIGYDRYTGGNLMYSGNSGALWLQTPSDLTFKTFSSQEEGAEFKAQNPTPASPSTVDKAAGSTLNWLAGDGAVTHKVYWSDGMDAVVNRTVTPLTLTVAIDGNTTATPSTPELGKTYYWTVDEIRSGPVTASGYLWQYTTIDYIYVDDMEDYDLSGTSTGNEIWNVWVDGYYSGNGAAVVGTTDAHSGTGAMEYNYSNNGTSPYGSSISKYYSEVEADTSNLNCGSNWTADGVAFLDIWFKGKVGNDPNERMYVVIEDGATPTPNEAMVQYGLPDGYSNPAWPEDMNNIKLEIYKSWAIDLRSFAGVNLGNVQKVYIGFGERDNITTAGGTGTVLIDEIKLRVPGLYRPQEDFVEDLYNDGVINFKDIAIFAGKWRVIEYDGIWPEL